MAFGKKCYCCEEVYPKDDLFYCEECLMKLSKAFKTGEGVVLNPKHYDHCISCGEYENRKIVYTGNTRLFPTHPKDSVPICDKCVQEELKKYREKGYRYTLMVLYAMGIVVCFICNLAIFNTLSWFFIVLTAELVAASLTLVPVLTPKNRCMWTLGAFTVSLGLLLMTCCLYTEGDWFFVAYIPILYGLSVVFLPFILRAVFLPAPLSRHKALICFTVDSLLLLLLLFVCDLYTHGGWFLSIAVPSALFCLILPWGIMAVIRYTKMNAFYKTAACFGLTAAFDYTFVGVMDFILGQKPYRFGFHFNFANWSLSFLSDNINMIIFLSLLFLAVLFALAGIVLSAYCSKQQTHLR